MTDIVTSLIIKLIIKKKNLSNINNNNNKLKDIIQETIYKLQRNCL